VDAEARHPSRALVFWPSAGFFPLRFELFVAEQDHRVDGESAPGVDQGGDNADAEHGENDATQDDRGLWRGLIHDR